VGYLEKEQPMDCDFNCKTDDTNKPITSAASAELLPALFEQKKITAKRLLHKPERHAIETE
jgi:hypothetical protein